MKKSICLLALILTFAISAYATENLSDSITGLNSVKAVIDLNQGKANLLDLRLNFIKKTFEHIKLAGGKPDFIVAVRGGASAFMTYSDKHIDSSDAGLKKIMHQKIKEMKNMGIRFQQCEIAMTLLKIEPSDIISEIEIVKNGYVTLIGYQNKGYALLPME
jgi:intracellular sulfur oxidation DsrE/DsrF family protein